MERLTAKWKNNNGKVEYTYKGNSSVLNREIDKLGKLEDLEEQLGCPLEVRCKVTYDSYVYDEDGCSYTKIIIFKDYILAYDGSEDVNGMLEPTKFYWKDYKKTWWLKRTREE